MKTHELAEYLWNRPDEDVYLLQDPDCSLLKEYGITRELKIDGVGHGRGDASGKTYLQFRAAMTEAEKRANSDKQSRIRNSHPDRLLSASRSKSYPTDKIQAQAVVREAMKKGYNILPADDPLKDRRGLVVYKDIEGIEVAYNPTWPREDGFFPELASAVPYVYGKDGTSTWQ